MSRTFLRIGAVKNGGTDCRAPNGARNDGTSGLQSFILCPQIPVGIILYEMKKGLNKRFFQKKHKKRLIFLSEYGIIRLYFIR